MNGHALPIISKDTCDLYFTNGIYCLDSREIQNSNENFIEGNA